MQQKPSRVRFQNHLQSRAVQCLNMQGHFGPSPVPNSLPNFAESECGNGNSRGVQYPIARFGLQSWVIRDCHRKSVFVEQRCRHSPSPSPNSSSLDGSKKSTGAGDTSSFRPPSLTLAGRAAINSAAAMPCRLLTIRSPPPQGALTGLFLLLGQTLVC